MKSVKAARKRYDIYLAELDLKKKKKVKRVSRNKFYNVK